MRFVRQIIDDVMSGGVLAALLAVMILMQGMVGGYAQSASLLGVGDGIICSAHAPVQPQQAPAHQADCCLAACQISASFAHILPPQLPVLPAVVAARVTPLAKGQEHAPVRRTPGLPGSPRAPPSHPV